VLHITCGRPYHFLGLAAEEGATVPSFSRGLFMKVLEEIGGHNGGALLRLLCIVVYNIIREGMEMLL
jgi:hypothetical protein